AGRRERRCRRHHELLRPAHGRRLLVSLDLTRRELLRIAAAAAAAWKAGPWVVRAPAAFAQTPPGDPLTVATLEAFADTLIPGEKRSPDDRAIAGAAPGAGAVQAGALEMMSFPAAGTGPGPPGLAARRNTHPTAFAGQNAIVLDPTVPPFRPLDLAQPTAPLAQTHPLTPRRGNPR